MVREGVGVIEEPSSKLAAKADAGISVLTLKWLEELLHAANQQQQKNNSLTTVHLTVEAVFCNEIHN